MQKSRRKHSKAKMYVLIRHGKTSGLSQRHFSHMHGIAKSTFSYWRKKYVKETDRRKGDESFIPVKVDQAVQ